MKLKKIIPVILVLVLNLSVLSVYGNETAGNTNNTPAASVNSKGEISYAHLSDEEIQTLFAQEEASQRTIHIGYDGGLCQVAIPVAQHLGFFEDEGLVTELVAAEDFRDALAAGKIDTSAGMIAAWLTSVQNGVDIRFTVGLHTGCSAAVTLPDSEIDGFAAGLKIGVQGAIGGPQHNIGLRMAAHDGFTADDITWLSFDSSALLLALQNHEVDAVVASEQLTQQWINNGDVKQIRSITTDCDFENESCCVMGISGQFLDANPVASYKITRAIYRASLWLAQSEENRAEAARILVDNEYVAGSEEYTLQLLNYYRFGLDNDTTETTLYNSVDEYQQLGIVSQSTDADAFKAQIWLPFDLDDLAA